MPEDTSSTPNGECQSSEALSISGGGYYEIKVKGHIDQQWADWFGELSISHDECGLTTISGMIVDQAALHGILAHLRDLGLPLIFLTVKGKETT